MEDPENLFFVELCKTVTDLLKINNIVGVAGLVAKKKTTDKKGKGARKPLK